MRYEDDVIRIESGLTRYTVIRKNISHVSVETVLYSPALHLQDVLIFRVHLMNGEQIVIDESTYKKIEKILNEEDR